MNPPKIVITGITSFRNHGVEALVVSTIAALRGRLPGATFTVLDRAPEYDASLLPDRDVKFVHDHTIRPLHAGRLRRLATRVAPKSDKLAEAARREIATADCVVASGGDVFCSEYGHRSLLSHLQPLKVALSHKVPFILHAQSIGPFTGEEDSGAFLATARHAAMITVREQASFRYLIDTLRLPPEQVRHVADPAFLLTQPDQEAGDALFAHHRADPSKPTIALSVSQAICHWMKSNADRHVDTWLEVIGWLRSELDANLILIPHVQELSNANHDMVLASELQRKLGWDPRVRVAGGDFSAGEYKAIISRCDLVIAERMHAALAGLSSGRPTLVIGYSIKAEGILTDLLGAEVTKNAALISIQDFLAPGAGLARVKAAWEARGTLAAGLAATVPEAKLRAAQAYDCIVEAAAGGGTPA